MIITVQLALINWLMIFPIQLAVIVVGLMFLLIWLTVFFMRTIVWLIRNVCCNKWRYMNAVDTIKQPMWITVSVVQFLYVLVVFDWVDQVFGRDIPSRAICANVIQCCAAREHPSFLVGKPLVAIKMEILWFFLRVPIELPSLVDSWDICMHSRLSLRYIFTAILTVSPNNWNLDFLPCSTPALIFH